jgi:hypothetical protein
MRLSSYREIPNHCVEIQNSGRASTQTFLFRRFTTPNIVAGPASGGLRASMRLVHAYISRPCFQFGLYFSFTMMDSLVVRSNHCRPPSVSMIPIRYQTKEAFQGRTCYSYTYPIAYSTGAPPGSDFQVSSVKEIQQSEHPLLNSTFHLIFVQSINYCVGLLVKSWQHRVLPLQWE